MGRPSPPLCTPSCTLARHMWRLTTPLASESGPPTTAPGNTHKAAGPTRSWTTPTAPTRDEAWAIPTPDQEGMLTSQRKKQRRRKRTKMYGCQHSGSRPQVQQNGCQSKWQPGDNPLRATEEREEKGAGRGNPPDTARGGRTTPSAPESGPPDKERSDQEPQHHHRAPATLHLNARREDQIDPGRKVVQDQGTSMLQRKRQRTRLQKAASSHIAPEQDRVRRTWLAGTARRADARDAPARTTQRSARPDTSSAQWAEPKDTPPEACSAEPA